MLGGYCRDGAVAAGSNQSGAGGRSSPRTTRNANWDRPSLEIINRIIIYNMFFNYRAQELPANT